MDGSTELLSWDTDGYRQLTFRHFSAWQRCGLLHVCLCVSMSMGMLFDCLTGSLASQQVARDCWPVVLYVYVCVSRDMEGHGNEADS